MKHDIFEDKLFGIVEIDDAVMKSDNGTRWEGGAYVLGMASRSGDIKLQILNKLRGEEVRRVVAENVDYVQVFYTDGHKLYRKMHELGPHQYVVHQKKWVDGEVHVSFVENAWSLFKRGLVGMSVWRDRPPREIHHHVAMHERVLHPVPQAPQGDWKAEWLTQQSLPDSTPQGRSVQ